MKFWKKVMSSAVQAVTPTLQANITLLLDSRIQIVIQ